MQKHYTSKGKHLTIDNRRLIERWELENKSKILKVSSSLAPKLEIRLRQRNKVELTLGQVGN